MTTTPFLPTRSLHLRKALRYLKRNCRKEAYRYPFHLGNGYETREEEEEVVEEEAGEEKEYILFSLCSKLACLEMKVYFLRHCHILK